MPAFMDKLLRAGEGKTLRRLSRLAKQVNAIEEDFEQMDHEQLQDMTQEFRKRLHDCADEDLQAALDDLLPEAFATVREAARRTLGQRHYDVQIMGGAALHLGNIAEMKTGEGKTLVATLPAYLNALAGKGVHVVTVNDYLAERDADWMGRIYRFLGLEVGVILSSMTPSQRRKEYACDITYGTNNEFGFDFLRDNMAVSLDEKVQRGHYYAIVDEVDSILVDEARTPLIISGAAEGGSEWYKEFARIVAKLERGESNLGKAAKGDTIYSRGDYEVDEKKRSVGILDRGVERVEDEFGIDNLYDSVNTPLVGYLNNAIRAKELFVKDKEYVVADGQIYIVDEHTGRILSGRRYSEGLHQAIEAKEGVEVKPENHTLASITLQNYFRLYDKLSGMTGTAQTEAAEFHSTYKLGVVPIPTNKPMQRLDRTDLIYTTEDAKFKAVVEDLVIRHRKGQPVLVGTVSVEKSEKLSSMLTKRRVRHEVLNAKQHEREASIVAEAGRKGSVTVATNMAGRGTDIMLGGNVDFIAREAMSKKGLDSTLEPELYEAAWPAALEAAEKAVAVEHEEVLKLGGLYVLGTERHESRRIDNQLRGRSGRQGDPGESRFYLSLQDDLMRRFNAALVENLLTRMNLPEDIPIEHRIVSNAVRSAQTQMEAQNVESRKELLKYDDVLNKQRMVIYEERRRVLEGEDLHDQVINMISDVVGTYVREATSVGVAEEWDLEKLWTSLKMLYPISVTVEDLIDKSGGTDVISLDAQFLEQEIVEDALDAYERREQELTPEILREVERRVMLSVLDRKWREHLYEMDYLKEGIGLRSMAQRDPVVEYQREGYDMFMAMTDSIKEESVGYMFNVDVQVPPEILEAAQQGRLAQPQQENDEQQELSPGQVPQGHQPSQAYVSLFNDPDSVGAGVMAKGLEVSRPQQLNYSAPALDGAAGQHGVIHHQDLDGDGTYDRHYLSSGEEDQQRAGNRAQRRAAKRKRRKGDL